MADERVQRRLAAILAADAVGYSRLMSVDEAGTRARFNAHLRDLIEPAVADHRGRIVKTTGDGLLVEFASVVDTVQCAVVIQRGMAERNADAPDDRRIDFRIGVNLGDVIIEGDDIHGDGVNIAARLEGVAEAGAICVSVAVYEQVRKKLDLDFEDLGERRVKNIAEAIRVYQLRPGKAPAAASLALPEKPSVAVLPFDNMSGDPEQEYFSDGITEDIITDLSKISALFVIARNSSFAYKGAAVDVKRVAADLGVRYVVEGSVRKAANRVRITAQLIDGTTGGHVWAERYDRNLDDIFAVQDEVTQSIVEALKIRLTDDERERTGGQTTTDMEAYDLALRGRDLSLRFTPETNAEAAKMFARAIELDPEFVTAHAGLALVLSADHVNDWNAAEGQTLERCVRSAETAVALDGADALGHCALAVARLWNKELDRAAAEAETTVALDPNNSLGHAILGNVYGYAGQPAEAVTSVEKAMRLDPQFPDIYLHFLAHAHLVLGDYEDAAELLKSRIRRYPETDSSRVLLASCYGHLGRAEEAREQWAEALRVNPRFSLDQKADVLPYKDPGDWQRIVDGLNKAGLPV